MTKRVTVRSFCFLAAASAKRVQAGGLSRGAGSQMYLQRCLSPQRLAADSRRSVQRKDLPK
jgi:hypothetical protein